MNITEGAYAGISVNGKFYDGYLRELSFLTKNTAVVCVSIVASQEIEGTAKAEVYGGIAENVVIIPETCIFKDEKGSDSVMIASKGYCVKRNVTVGDIRNSKGVQIKEGLFPDEKIVTEPQKVKTGDKYK